MCRLLPPLFCQQPRSLPHLQHCLPHSLLLCLFLTLPCLPQPAHATARALLIGIGHYQDAHMPPLEGPPHDVAALRDVLQQRWDFAPQHVQTLLDGQATRAGILQALGDLERRSKHGDEIVIYFSGHGTSLHDSSGFLPMAHDTGAFVPYDFPLARSRLEDLIVGRTDLRPVLKKLEDGGRKVWMIADTCYSGELARLPGPPKPERLPARLLMLPDLAGKARVLREAATANRLPSSPYPYRNVQFLAAAGAGEPAREISERMLSLLPTRDGKPHGTFTDALLRVLHGEIAGDLNQDGYLSLDEVQRATSEFMDERPYNHSAQRLPHVAEDVHGLGAKPVLGSKDKAAKPRGQALPELRLLNLLPDPALKILLASVPHVAAPGKNGEADVFVGMAEGAAQLWQVSASSGEAPAQIPADEAGAAQKLHAQIRQLAFARHMQALATQYRHSALAVALDPAGSGGKFKIGDKARYALRPERTAVIVVLNIDAAGKVAVLYPKTGAQAVSKAAGKVVFIPDANVEDRFSVTAPAGVDFQMHFAFDHTPPALEAIRGLNGLDSEDERVRKFLHGLREMQGKFAFAQTTLRTLE